MAVHAKDPLTEVALKACPGKGRAGPVRIGLAAMEEADTVVVGK